VEGELIMLPTSVHSLPRAPAPGRRCHSTVVVAVADHDDPVLLKDPLGKRWYEMSKAGQGFDSFIEWLGYGSRRPFNNPEGKDGEG
jgi:hypothetical protein